jgi:non-ribosomal peptide synthase protein (TIGR01720 family)
MVPAVFVELAGLPLTPSGKVDRAALPAPGAGRPELAVTYTAPSTPIQEVLAEIWTEVLGLDEVGVDDNFFELGGDSIVSIQVVARARRAGIHVTPAELFEHQTIAKLAAVAVRDAPLDAEQGLVTGEAPLVPIQRWFFGRDLPEPHHFNQSFALELSEPVDPGLLRQALAALVDHHDGLRSRFVRRDGAWVASVEPALSYDPFTVIDLADLDELQELASEAQASLDIEAGHLVRWVLFDRAQHGQVLLLVIHHLVVDGVSWRILLEDLAHAIEQLEESGTVELPDKTTSAKRWAERLGELATSEDVLGEVSYWREVVDGAAGLPRDHDESRNDVATAQVVEVELDREQTSKLLQVVPSAYRTQINDALLTALGLVISEWTGRPRVLVDLEGHGREDVGRETDVSRTVGWFTTLFPVAIDLGSHDGDLGVALKHTKEQLRRIPRRGLGYGLLRYLADDSAVGNELAERLRAAPPPELSFNYLGQFDTVLGSDGRFREASGPLGAEIASSGSRTHLIEVNSVVSDGRLQLAWVFSEQIHERATVERLARRYLEALGRLIDHCCNQGNGGYTPSDFPLAGLDQSTLDQLQARMTQSEGGRP